MKLKKSAWIGHRAEFFLVYVTTGLSALLSVSIRPNPQ